MGLLSPFGWAWATLSRMRAVPSSSALALGLLAAGGAWLSQGAAPAPLAAPPADVGARVAALEAGGPQPWLSSGPRARFVEALGLLTSVERELDQMASPLGDAWRHGVDGARRSRAATLGGWMARLQGVLARDPDPAWQEQRRSSPAWTSPARPRRVASPEGVAAALRLVDPTGSAQQVREVSWVGGGHVLLLGSGAAWVGGVGRPLRRLAFPAGTRGPLGLLGTYARAPWEVAVRASQDGRDVIVPLRLDGPGGPRTLGAVPAEGPCDNGVLQLRRLGNHDELELEISRDCGGARVARDLWPLRQGRYRPPLAGTGPGFRVVLRG